MNLAFKWVNLNWEVMRTNIFVILSTQSNRAFKQSITQMSPDIRDDRPVLNYSRWQGSVTAQDKKAHLRTAQRRTEFYLGRWQIADVCLCSLQYALCMCRSRNNPPGREIHLKFGLWGTIKTPNSVPKFKPAWNPPAALGWLLCLLPPLSVMWHNVSDVAI